MYRLFYTCRYCVLLFSDEITTSLQKSNIWIVSINMLGLFVMHESWWQGCSWGRHPGNMTEWGRPTTEWHGHHVSLCFLHTRTHTTPHCLLKYVSKDNGGCLWLWNTAPLSKHTQIQKSTCACVHKKVIWLCMNLSLVTVRKVFMGTFAF